MPPPNLSHPNPPPSLADKIDDCLDLDVSEMEMLYSIMRAICEHLNVSTNALEAVAQNNAVIVPRHLTVEMADEFHDTILIECNPADKSASVLNDLQTYLAVVEASPYIKKEIHQ
jgi:hypothetical protein